MSAYTDLPWGLLIVFGVAVAVAIVGFGILIHDLVVGWRHRS